MTAAAAAHGGDRADLRPREPVAVPLERERGAGARTGAAEPALNQIDEFGAPQPPWQPGLRRCFAQVPARERNASAVAGDGGE